MKIYTVAIVEDLDSDAQLVETYLRQYSQQWDIYFDIQRFLSGESFLSDARKHYDLVFMDMQLTGIDGLDTSYKFRKRNCTAELIFVTSIEHYAVKGYDAGADDFILKPFGYPIFEAKLKKAIQRLVAADTSVPIRVSTKGQLQLIPARNIVYMEVVRHDVIYHTIDGEITAYGSLNKTEAELSGADFARCCSWCLVNLKYVEGIYGDEIRLTVGTTLHMSRGKRKSFLEALTRYCTTGRK